MRPKQSHLPITHGEVHNYHYQIAKTDEFLAARETVQLAAQGELERAPNDEARRRIVRALTRRTMAQAAGNLIKNTGAYEQLKFDPAYNVMLSTLPDLNDGVRGLREQRGDRRAHKEKIIHFNHAVKNLINTHAATSPDDLTEMLKNTFFFNGYSGDLLDEVENNIIPGMEHELAFESNLFYLPREPEIIETTIEDELNGVDYIIRYRDGIVITIDVKKGVQSAEKRTREEADWRKKKGITAPTNRLIIASGYREGDFVAGKIGRVTEAAREREQTRINTLIDSTYQALAAHRLSIDNVSKI